MSNKSNDLVSKQYSKESNSILFEKGKTFYWAKLFLNKHAAKLATRLYRFCRYIDDLADEANDKNQAHECLNKIKVQLNLGTSNDAVIVDAINLFHECKIPIQIPIELINGVLADLALDQIESEVKLIEYCYQVAGTVGIMMCKVLNVSHPDALYHAVDLGIAMQLTNICRDVYEDALLGRVYLPKSLVGPINSNNIITPSDESRIKVLNTTLSLLIKADLYYKSAYIGLVHLPLRSRISILIAAKLYQQIGFEIINSQNFDLKSRVFVSFKMKFLITIKVCFKALFDRKFWMYLSSHDKTLHQSINKLPFCNG